MCFNFKTNPVLVLSIGVDKLTVLIRVYIYGMLCFIIIPSIKNSIYKIDDPRHVLHFNGVFVVDLRSV